MTDHSGTAVDFLKARRDGILGEWVTAQEGDPETRSDLLGSDEVRRQSAVFLDGLLAALDEAGLATADDPAYQPVHRMLEEASLRRERLGIPASGTAVWILMLKDFWILPMLDETGTSEDVLEEARRASHLLERLALKTYEGRVERREETIRLQAGEIIEISTPIIKVWDGVVAAPLIGTLDSERTQRFMERLLEAITATNSPVALVDITGVPTIDTQTAQHLIDTVSAVRLLGSRVILTGVRPSIAQTLVHLGIPMSDITTRSSFAGGLRVALDMLDLEVTARPTAA